MDATEAYGWGDVAELRDSGGEAFGVEPRGFAVSAGLIHALAVVGDDQGDEGTGPGDHPEGKFHQVKERLRVKLGGGVNLLEVEQHHQPVEDDDCGGKGESQRPANPPQPQLRSSGAD
ncbi:hypothetical protein ACFWSJ_25575 [Streptomyces niveus]|uniref:hypothetical protein n=1 Tax=Streptomyces niveus TaxID=193462 RepID=UPI003656920D